MRTTPGRLGIALALALAAPAAGAGPEPAPTPEGIEFFEARVRPVLAERCLKCHGPDEQKSDLRLDSRAAMLKGGSLGPAVVPGDPDGSLLVEAVRQSDEFLKMPPKDRLPDEAVAAIVDWVEMGAPWPESPGSTADAKADAAGAHWAFQPVRKVDPPAVSDPSWAADPIDAFVFARLEAEGLAPSPEADRRTLIRRVTFDLTGLPPTPEEVEAFLGDASPGALARVVDRLLASPRYGERWGRHWLDVARYADTKGYVFQEERRYPYAYTYRDWVVDALNRDLPYDQFVIRQIAADTAAPDDPEAQAALGFLTVGRRFLNNRDDIIDDRIDVVTRGLMGLTVACARCHDHKYDPIPQEDYYSLHGVFASSEEPDDLPVIGESSGPEAEDYRAQRAARVKEAEDFAAGKRDELARTLREQVAAYLVAAFELEFTRDRDRLDDRARADGLRVGLLRKFSEDWKARLDASKDGSDPLLAPWHAFAAIPAEGFAAKAAEVRATLAGQGVPEPILAAIVDPAPESFKNVVQRYGELLARAARGDADVPEAARALAAADDGPLAIREDETRRLFDRAEREKLQALRRRVAELDVNHPGAPPRAMALRDRDQPVEPHVYLRGNPGRPGPQVPRRFPAVLSGPDREPFAQGSGRLELARAIASAENPLTARVIVNRVWQHHFGRGLVATASDFGLRSDPPTHPELLDWLAATFVEEGWSLKRLHRRIVLSKTYRQASGDRPECAATDPENRWLWRQNRRRLEFEAMRDAILAAAGTLDGTIGGRPVSIVDRPYSTRRTLYAFIDRQNLEGVFRTFDLASPNASSPGRPETSVPQQALYLMNNPFVVEQARALARRAESASGGDRASGVQALYGWLFGRPATDADVERALRFVEAQGSLPTGAEDSPWHYGFGAFDESTGRVARFEPFPHWTGDTWQLGPDMPTPDHDYLHRNAQGGHVGPSQERAAILRWVAPADATVAIEGTLRHRSKEGDGVRGRIVSDRAGLLGEWVAHDGEVSTDVERVDVKAGETIDFVADCRAAHDFDGFTWAPVLQGVGDGSPGRWDARADFHGPAAEPLTAWEAYAQVLLLTNEFLYLD